MKSIFIEDNLSDSDSNKSSDDTLSVACPFLNHSRVNYLQEMATCGAYRNRMVLGGRRLQDICTSERHFECPYYLEPRLKS